MKVKVKIHRGLQFKGTPVHKPEEYEEVEFEGGSLTDFLKTIHVDPRSVGLMIINGRIAVEPDRIQIKPCDIIEFFPHVMGG